MSLCPAPDIPAGRTALAVWCLRAAWSPDTVPSCLPETPQATWAERSRPSVSLAAALLVSLLKKYFAAMYDKMRFYKGYLESIGLSVDCEVMDQIDEANEQFALGLESEAEEAGAELADEGAISSGVGQKVKIIMSMLQITSALMDIIEIVWPANFINLVLGFSFVNFDLPTLLSFDCLIQDFNFRGWFLLLTFFPIVFTLFWSVYCSRVAAKAVTEAAEQALKDAAAEEAAEAKEDADDAADDAAAVSWPFPRYQPPPLPPRAPSPVPHGQDRTPCTHRRRRRRWWRRRRMGGLACARGRGVCARARARKWMCVRHARALCPCTRRRSTPLSCVF